MKVVRMTSRCTVSTTVTAVYFVKMVVLQLVSNHFNAFPLERKRNRVGLTQVGFLVNLAFKQVIGCINIIALKTNTGFNIHKGEILSCGMTPSTHSNEQVPEVSEPVTEETSEPEPVTTSAPQSQAPVESASVESQESEIPITSFCGVNDLNAHFKNSNLRFNCGKKSCTGRVYFYLSLIESNFPMMHSL